MNHDDTRKIMMMYADMSYIVFAENVINVTTMESSLARAERYDSYCNHCRL